MYEPDHMLNALVGALKRGVPVHIMVEAVDSDGNPTHRADVAEAAMRMATATLLRYRGRLTNLRSRVKPVTVCVKDDNGNLYNPRGARRAG